MLIAKDISHFYGAVGILSNVSLSVHPGSVTVLMGRSGSGKSTLIRLLSLIERPRSGLVSLNSGSLSPSAGSPSTPIWPRITVVFQQLFLWPHLTLEQNIRLPVALRNKDTTDIHAVCQALSITEVLHRYPNEVSVGQRQRCAVARSVLLRPQFLLLDEITSAQDIEQIANLLALCVRIVESGVGLLVVTHHIGFARQLLARSQVGQVVFLDNGKVVESGDKGCIDAPTTEAFRSFLAIIQTIA